MRPPHLVLLAVLALGVVIAWQQRDVIRGLWPGSEAGEPAVPTPLLGHDSGDADSGDAGAPGSAAPPPVAGHGELTIALHGAPARFYAAPGQDDATDAEYRAIVAAAAAELGAGEVLYDWNLARAAREIAFHTGALGVVPPEAAMSFLLHAAGAPESSASQLITHTRSEHMDAVKEAVRRAIQSGPDGRGPLRLGVGEVSTPGQAFARHVIVLTTRRAYALEPTPRQVAPGEAWVMRGQVPGSYEALTAAVLYPDGRAEEAAVARDGQRFVVTVPAGDRAGTLHVDVSGTDDRGPGKVVQLSVEVGRDLPTSTRVHVPEADGEFERLEDAEEYALDLINGDRARLGLDLLEPDARLTDIARAHSEEMRDRGFFGHQSPITGLLRDRMARAGYRAVAQGENLARNDSLAEAQAALMASVGHRQNILSPRFTHAGVGLARRQDGERVEWFVTQVFARPVRALDPGEATGELIARIQAARVERGTGPVLVDAQLSAVAQRHAQAVADGALEGMAQQVLADVADRSASMSVVVHAVHDLADLAVPEAALEPGVTAVGVGVLQSSHDPHGRTGVVVLTQQGPGR